MDSNKTDFSKVCEILSDLWMDYREDEEFSDFIEYNDIGLPLAYAFANDIAKPSDIGKGMVEETWALFLTGFDLEDTGFDSLDDILGIAEQQRVWYSITMKATIQIDIDDLDYYDFFSSLSDYEKQTVLLNIWSELSDEAERMLLCDYDPDVVAKLVEQRKVWDKNTSDFSETIIISDQSLQLSPSGEGWGYPTKIYGGTHISPKLSSVKL